MEFLQGKQPNTIWIKANQMTNINTAKWQRGLKILCRKRENDKLHTDQMD